MKKTSAFYLFLLVSHSVVYAETAPELGFEQDQAAVLFNKASQKLGYGVRIDSKGSCEEVRRYNCVWPIQPGVQLSVLTLAKVSPHSSYQMVVKLSSNHIEPISLDIFGAACQIIIAMTHPNLTLKQVLTLGGDMGKVVENRFLNKEMHLKDRSSQHLIYADWYVPSRPETGEGYAECGVVAKN